MVMTDVYEECESLHNAADDIYTGWKHGDTAGAMRAVAHLNERLSYVATELVERGAKEGMTQRRMAECLDIPQSALRGARKEFAS